ncbi:unnamed protein product [Prorocentrum cordatum]|uniref:Cupin-like domain-containing protein n=1 Tax=Prorocentrum cordatum TaxID=2364126 RepID=A0ABN9SBC5_9DINO|nr:unnamed protein product [Polarella glacialis]
MPQDAARSPISAGAAQKRRAPQIPRGRGAYSRLHYDQNANLYLQVRGAKRWLIFPPECGPMLYPYPKGHPLDRKARLDPEEPVALPGGGERRHGPALQQ